jgi:hypothetical protein
MPACILLVGAILTVWYSQRATVLTEVVHDHLLTLCENAARGDDITGQIQTGDTLMRMQFVQAIKQLTGGHTELLTNVRVDVQPGDVDTYSDGSASHVAYISLNNVPKLIVRVRCRSRGHVEIIGYQQIDA